MNARIVRALFMEHATRSWPFLAAGFVLGSLYVLPDWAFQGHPYQYEIEGAVQTVALVVAMLGLLYTVADGDRLSCEFPERILLLPVPTSVIVLARFLFNVAAVALLSLFIHILLRLTTGGPHDDWWAYPVLGVIVVVVLQTVALAVGCLGDWALGVLLGAFVAIMVYIGGYGNSMPTETVIAAPFWIFGVCLSISCGVVHLRRTGRWDPQLFLPGLRAINKQSVESSIAPFKSALDAQRWFEARRARPFLITTLASVAAVTIAFNRVPRVFTDRFEEHYSMMDRTLWALGQYGTMLPYIFVLCAGFTGSVMLFQNYRLQFGPLRAFLYIRPISSADLARARVTGALRALAEPYLITVFLTLGLCSLWLFIDKENPSTPLTNLWTPIQLTGILSLVFLGVGCAAWLGYWTGNIFFFAALYTVFSISFGLLFTGMLELGWMNGYTNRTLEQTISAAIAVLTLLVLALATRRRFLPIRQLVIVLTFAIVLSGALWFASNWFDNGSHEPIRWNPNELPTCVLVALFTALPLAAVPLSLNWARHR